MPPKKWLATFAIMTMWSFGQNAIAEAGASQHHDRSSTDVKHSHHEAKGLAALTLNAGNKWVTDAPLRGAMANIHQAMEASLDKIHHGALSDSMYETLATKTQQEVANMVSQCKLPPDADAQLHLVITELLLGADAMAGKHAALSREQGATKVMAALNSYSKFFEDDNPRWRVELQRH